jgi:hypothetical protein
MGKRTEAEHPWERQAGESIQAYEAFSIYRDMGAERSLRGVQETVKKNFNLIARWSGKHTWVNRARLYDNFIEAKALRKAENDLAGMRARQIKIGIMMQQRGLKALENVKTDDMDPNAIVRLIKEGTKLENSRLNDEASAHRPAVKDSAEDEALKKLDEIMGKIESGF